MKKELLSFNDVNLTYPNGKNALFNVNLKVYQGEIIAFIGPSGAGKSTILNSINQLNKITSGQIIYNDLVVNELTKQKLRKYRQQIGTIFQGYNLVNELDVLTNVIIGKVYNHNFFEKLILKFSKEEKKQALDTLDRFGILEKAYTRCDALSGGQMQRVALSRIAYQNPKLILADEPTSALDPKLTKVVMQDFQKIQKQNDSTIIINLHNVASAISYCDRIIGVSEGQIIIDKKWQDLKLEDLNKVYGEFDELSSEQIQFLKDKRYDFISKQENGN